MSKLINELINFKTSYTKFLEFYDSKNYDMHINIFEELPIEFQIGVIFNFLDTHNICISILRESQLLVRDADIGTDYDVYYWMYMVDKKDRSYTDTFICGGYYDEEKHESVYTYLECVHEALIEAFKLLDKAPH